MAFAGTITKLLHMETDFDISKEIFELTRLTDGLNQVKILKDDFSIYVPLQKYLEVFIKCIVCILFSDLIF